MRFKMLLTLVK